MGRRPQRSFLCDAHGRDHITHAEMAFGEARSCAPTQDRALRAKTIANLGAYMSTFSSSVPTYLYATLLSGQYAIRRSIARLMRLYTNTVPVDAYRGARAVPKATFVVERLVEVGAREMEMDPVALRARTSSRAFPHQTPVIMTYDARRLCGLARQSAANCRYQGLRGAQASIRPLRQAARPRILDLYRSVRDCTSQAVARSAAASAMESAEVRVNPTAARSEVLTGSHSHGRAMRPRSHKWSPGGWNPDSKM